jgi:hypothetical protein
MKTAYMGTKTAREVAESWYNCVPEYTEYPPVCEDFTSDLVERSVSFDDLHIGINPAHALGEMGIIYIPLPVHLDKPNELNDPSDIANVLLRINNKRGFKLSIGFYYPELEPDLWTTAFNVFRPILEAFEQEGAHVRLYVTYAKYGYSTLSWDVNNAIKHSESNWREDAKEYSGTVSSWSRVHKYLLLLHFRISIFFRPGTLYQRHILELHAHNRERHARLRQEVRRLFSTRWI